MIRTRAGGRKPGVAKALGLPVFLFLFFLEGGYAQLQRSPVSDRQDSESYQISVNVNLVVLHAMVRDGKGSSVSNLRRQDFEVYEDGVRQSIQLFQHEDIPVNVGLVIDHSGSMRKKMADAIDGASTFVRSSNAQDQIFVVNFNEKVTLGLPTAIQFTNRSDELERAISRTPAAGMTALYDAVLEALQRLQAGSLDKKALIVISDGSDNASVHNLADLLKVAGQSSALIYPIGVFDDDDHDRNPGVLNRLARATGGEAFFPGQRERVATVCERIARDIRNQYTIGYASTNAAPNGVFRSIRVVARTPGNGKLIVRARSGYIAGVGSRPVKAEDGMRVVVTKMAVTQALRWTRHALLAGSVSILGYCGFVVVDAWTFQEEERRQLERLLRDRQSATNAGSHTISLTSLKESRPTVASDLIGRIEIPRLGLSAIVVEGTGPSTLRRSVGHIPGTALPGQPGNAGITAHRDTFFRPLRNIQQNDMIALSTISGEYYYRVVSTKIVSPHDVSVLDPNGVQALTLVTCHPFYFVGPAPNRFIVRAERVTW